MHLFQDLSLSAFSMVKLLPNQSDTGVPLTTLILPIALFLLNRLGDKDSLD